MTDVVTADDGLPATKVGAWTREKHERLLKYVGITRDVRRKFGNRTYIELFCGPGRSVIEDRANLLTEVRFLLHGPQKKAPLPIQTSTSLILNRAMSRQLLNGYVTSPVAFILIRALRNKQSI